MFLTELLESNDTNNIFYACFFNLENFEFTNKFISMHDMKKSILILSIYEFFS